ncbi:MAG: GH3 auxin-responsive promoter family protein [Chloroflexi bacterium]|nr:GH3 auxin-responsive promoter family protein [Chloroflexota bacterium]
MVNITLPRTTPIPSVLGRIANFLAWHCEFVSQNVNASTEWLWAGGRLALAIGVIASTFLLMKGTEIQVVFTTLMLVVAVYSIYDKSRGEGGLPRFEFLGRADDRIDLGGFTRLDEKTVWEALVLSELQYEEWSVRKEFAGGLPRLHMYIELKESVADESVADEEVRDRIHQKLKEVDPFYGDLESMLGIAALEATSLPKGTFDRFYDLRLRTGAELGRLKPPRMNATDEDIEDLLRVAG